MDYYYNWHFLAVQPHRLCRAEPMDYGIHIRYLYHIAIASEISKHKNYGIHIRHLYHIAIASEM